MAMAGAKWVGAAVPRKEDAALLTGNARFIDDLAPVAGIRHAAILRSPHAHARITRIDTTRAESLAGVVGVATGSQVAALVNPLPSAVRTPIGFMPIAVDKARYVGEPVAVVVAEDRALAEDAAELIGVEYEALPAAVDVEQALEDGAPLVHEMLGANLVNRRSFRYGDPDAAFARADRIFRVDARFPRYSSTPIETFGAIAQFERTPDRYTIWSNFQGPYILHALMTGSLKVPGNRLRLITPPASGGSFGIKQGMYGYMVLLAAVSRLTGAPVKWIEDRLEHLIGSSSAADRAGFVEAAFQSDGALIGLRFHNLVNVGAYLRAPEPASVYRMHSASNGCYGVRDIAIENLLVATNTLPVGLNRGYGGPQFYFALERVMEVAARGLGIDPAEIRRRNFVPKDAFPYQAPAGATFDSSDYAAGLDECLRLADYAGLKEARARARAEGRLFGIGLAAGVEPAGSNMAYVNLAQTVAERAAAGDKSGALATATVAMDHTGAVTVRTVSTPAGQGHATVAAQVVADALGLAPDDIDVITAIDTLTSNWSLASGNYGDRFASIVVTAIARCAERVADKLRLIAADELEVAPEDIELTGGVARVVGVPEKNIRIRRLAAKTHWNPAGLPQGVSPGIHESLALSPESLTSPDAADRVASAVTFAFVCDLAAVEIDRGTGALTIHKYVSVHDVGRVLNPLVVEGQIRGGFVHGLGGALFEEMVYDADGNMLTGTFADYLCPTALDVPSLIIGHVDHPSGANVLGSKGMGDGSSMLAPAVLANAAADALGVDDIALPPLCRSGIDALDESAVHDKRHRSHPEPRDRSDAKHSAERCRRVVASVKKLQRREPAAAITLGGSQ